MTTLNAYPATTLAHAEQIRTIRNATRGTYSAANDEIGWQEQQDWWKRTEGKRLAWVYHTRRYCPAPRIVGFGMLLLQDDGYWTTTVGVLPDSAGCGFGKAILHDIVSNCPGPCRAQALKSNVAGVRCHDLERDWDIVSGPDERYVYFRTKVGVPA